MSQCLVHFALLACTCLLAGGCCCPMLSGRYCDRCLPACPPMACAPCFDCYADQAPLIAPHCCRLSGLLFPGLAGGGDGVPSEQGPDYLSPQPKFHPVPTHPVFEPQPAYPPIGPIELGATNPLRPATATIATSRGSCR